MTSDRNARSTMALQPALGEGQTFKVVGIGGVGSIVARYGTVFLASLAESLGVEIRIVLVDGDSFEPGNATRMLFSTLGNKAAVTRAELSEHLMDSRVTLDSVEEYITEENIHRLLHPGDVILLTVDNHATRKLVSDFCSGKGQWSGLNDVCIISGGNDGIGQDSSSRVLQGTFGNCQVYVRKRGGDLCPDLTRHHEEIRSPVDKRPDQLSCVELLESVPQNLFANLMAACTILNSLWLYLCGHGALHYSEIVFDIAKGLMRPLPRPGPVERSPVPSSGGSDSGGVAL